ncbi:MAG: SPOR domain-containing protein [Treponema sp.]|jgi:rare lipoprotein A|nr:SPOR domain-containing protein [Treponema sp.]
MMKRIPAVFLLSLVGLMAAAQTQEGGGTWYETDSRGLNASHPNLPLGTRVRVTNLQNNKQVIVTVNDRIAEGPDRLIDLSKAAAENIGMSAGGATPVRIEIISRRPPASDSPPAETAPPAAPAAAAPPAPAPSAAAVPAAASPAPAAGAPANPGGSGITNQAIVTINGLPGSGAVAPSAVPAPVPATAPSVVPAPAPPPGGGPRPTAAPVPPVPAAAPAAAAVPAVPAPVPVPAPFSPSGGSRYRIQVGAFRGEANAAAAFNRLREAGFSPFYERYGGFYRVVLSGVGAAEVEGVTRRLGDAGFRDILIREER